MRHLFAVVLSLLVSIGTVSAAIDANTASADALQTIRGIGPKTAARIVAERRKGPFKDLADLQARVPGIGAAGARRMAAAGLTVGRAGAPAKDLRRPPTAKDERRPPSANDRRLPPTARDERRWPPVDDARRPQPAKDERRSPSR
jgi:competence protein ComEA